MFSIGYAVYLFIIATVLALLEIQIEGAQGWAKNLPCWRPNPDSFIARSYARVMSGKSLTGYHIAMFSLVLITLHIPFFAGISWGLVKQLEVFSAFFLLTICWDFLWFIFNPHYGPSRFKAEYIWWHKNWIGYVPADYLGGITVSIILTLIAAALGGINVLVWWGIVFGILSGLTLVTYLIFRLLRKGWV